jgi:acyl-CoA synthetase (AMP-forming)/AMP-acid ligase II
MAHSAVAEAVVMGVEHPTWQERPLACVVVKPGKTVTKDDTLAHLKEKFPSWWMPDDVIVIEEVPKTSVGKFDKKVLRERNRQYRFSVSLRPLRRRSDKAAILGSPGQCAYCDW